MALLEQGLERCVFHSRWLLLPFYLGLVLALFALMVHFGGEVVHLLRDTFLGSDADADRLIAVLRLIDLALLANLMIIVILNGYESFVSRIRTHGDERPEWMGTFNLTDLKIALMGALAAISGIYLLEAMIDSQQDHWLRIVLKLAIHLTFVISAILFALAKKIEAQAELGDNQSRSNPH